MCGQEKLEEYEEDRLINRGVPQGVTMRTMRTQYWTFLYCPRLALPFTADHCRQSSNWFGEWQHWEAELHNAVFSDESDRDSV